MRRLTAMFVAVCMVVMAGSLGAVLFLAAGLPAIPSAVVALAALSCLALYNTITSRLRDRTDLGDQIADLSRGTSDLARQVAELGRRLTAMEERVDSTVNRARGAMDPIAAEMGELGGLMKQLAETVAGHELRLRGQALASSPATFATEPPADMPLVLTAADIATPSAVESEPVALATQDPGVSTTGPFRGLSRDSIVAMISGAVEAHRVDLYLQPIVTLPQRKVRYYEAMSRLRTPEGEVVAADQFLDFAESGGVMPKIDNLLLFRCVQVVRRLLLKNRDVGLFCNISIATLTDPAYFRQFHDFMQANRALAPSMVFEFRQAAYRSFGPIEHEGMAALADLGFRFSLDHVTDLRIDPKELHDHGFRFLKAPAKLLFNKAASAQSDIDPADLSSLLARFNIELVAERIENESMVVDLLDFEVKFGQGFLFSPPRPVRPEALHVSVPPSADQRAADGPAVAELPAVPERPSADGVSSKTALDAPDFVPHAAPVA